MAASCDRDSPPDPYTSGSAVHSRRKASHAPIATVAATAEGAYNNAHGTTGGARVVSKAAFTNGAVPTATAASISEVGVRIAIVGHAATAAMCTTVC